MLAHESAMARMERIIHRLWALVIIIFLALIITNGAWIYYVSQFEVVEETTDTVTQTVEASGNSDAVMAGIGDATNGSESETDSQKESDYKTVSEEKEEINE